MVILKIEALKSILFHKIVKRLDNLKQDNIKSTKIKLNQDFNGDFNFLLYLLLIFQIACKEPVLFYVGKAVTSFLFLCIRLPRQANHKYLEKSTTTVKDKKNRI